MGICAVGKLIRGNIPDWCYGYGYGGSGYGSGYGDGDGYGGYGYGYGSGYGSGYGYGYGSQEYCVAAFIALKKIETLPDGRLLLFKSVRPDDGTDFHTGKIKYDGVVECPDWDPDQGRECGAGLHVSPTGKEALEYHAGKLKRVAVHRDDIAVYWKNMTKVRCRKLEVLGDG